MADENILRFLAPTEPGAMAILATALARHEDGALPSQQSNFYLKFSQTIMGLELSLDGPSRVLYEYENIDLVLLWDDWAIGIEGKVASGAVRNGQLQEYYDRLRTRVGQASGLPTCSRVAMVFLTPGAVGKSKFDLLSVQSSDVKKHCSWEDVLVSLEESFDLNCVPQDGQPILSSLIVLGAKQIRNVIEGRRRSKHVPIDPVDQWPRSKEFIAGIKAIVRELLASEPVHYYRDSYTVKNVVEFWATFESNRAGYVGFALSSEESRIEDNDLNDSRVAGLLHFKVMRHATEELKDRFLAMKREQLIALLGEDAFEINVDKNELVTIIEMTGTRSKLMTDLARKFTIMMLAFRSIMA